MFDNVLEDKDGWQKDLVEGTKTFGNRDVLIHMNSFPWELKLHLAKMEMNSGSGVSQDLRLAGLLLPRPRPQGQVYLALNQLWSISVSSPRIWQAESCWLPDRIHQIHFPDAITSHAERKVGCLGRGWKGGQS